MRFSTTWRAAERLFLRKLLPRAPVVVLQRPSRFPTCRAGVSISRRVCCPRGLSGPGDGLNLGTCHGSRRGEHRSRKNAHGGEPNDNPVGPGRLDVVTRGSRACSVEWVSTRKRSGLQAKAVKVSSVLLEEENDAKKHRRWRPRAGECEQGIDRLGSRPNHRRLFLGIVHHLLPSAFSPRLHVKVMMTIMEPANRQIPLRVPSNLLWADLVIFGTYIRKNVFT